VQVFVAPGDEDLSLPVEPSPWHRRRWVRLPYEHWSLILAFASGIDPKTAGLLERLSNIGASQLPDQSRAELRLAAEFLHRISSILPSAPPLVTTLTNVIQEGHPNEEHARMADAVAAVMTAGADTGEPIRAWVE
jgi:hypothetical protein